MTTTHESENPIHTDDDAFAFTTGCHGNRPTHLLTPTPDDGAAVTLYELVPSDVADGRQQRFDRKQKQVTVTQSPVEDVVVGGDTPNDVTTTTASESYQWHEWCAVKMCSLSGDSLAAISGLIEATLTDAGVDTNGILIGEGETICLPEYAGVRLTIAFKAIKRVQRRDKMRNIRNGIERMSLGECYYWHSKVKSPEEPTGTTALRELLTGHLD